MVLQLNTFLIVLVGSGEEVEHSGDPQGDSGRFSIPLNPKGDEG